MPAAAHREQIIWPRQRLQGPDQPGLISPAICRATSSAVFTPAPGPLRRARCGPRNWPARQGTAGEPRAAARRVGVARRRRVQPAEAAAFSGSEPQRAVAGAAQPVHGRELSAVGRAGDSHDVLRSREPAHRAGRVLASVPLPRPLPAHTGEQLARARNRARPRPTGQSRRQAPERRRPRARCRCPPQVLPRPGPSRHRPRALTGPRRPLQQTRRRGLEASHTTASFTAPAAHRVPSRSSQTPDPSMGRPSMARTDMQASARAGVPHCSRARPAGQSPAGSPFPAHGGYGASPARFRPASREALPGTSGRGLDSADELFYGVTPKIARLLGWLARLPRQLGRHSVAAFTARRGPSAIPGGRSALAATTPSLDRWTAWCAVLVTALPAAGGVAAAKAGNRCRRDLGPAASDGPVRPGPACSTAPFFGQRPRPGRGFPPQGAVGRPGLARAGDGADQARPGMQASGGSRSRAPR